MFLVCLLGRWSVVTSQHWIKGYYVPPMHIPAIGGTHMTFCNSWNSHGELVMNDLDFHLIHCHELNISFWNLFKINILLYIILLPPHLGLNLNVLDLPTWVAHEMCRACNHDDDMLYLHQLHLPISWSTNHNMHLFVMWLQYGLSYDHCHQGSYHHCPTITMGWRCAVSHLQGGPLLLHQQAEKLVAKHGIQVRCRYIEEWIVHGNKPVIDWCLYWQLPTW